MDHERRNPKYQSKKEEQKSQTANESVVREKSFSPVEVSNLVAKVRVMMRKAADKRAETKGGWRVVDGEEARRKDREVAKELLGKEIATNVELSGEGDADSYGVHPASDESVMQDARLSLIWVVVKPVGGGPTTEDIIETLREMSEAYRKWEWKPLPRRKALFFNSLHREGWRCFVTWTTSTTSLAPEPSRSRNGGVELEASYMVSLMLFG